MNYEPQARPARGIDPMLSNRLTGRCDICGKSRPHFKHDKCSKARQEAGFRMRAEKPADAKVKCVQCHGVFTHGSMMGNTCRDCYAAMYRRIFGTAPAPEVANG